MKDKPGYIFLCIFLSVICLVHLLGSRAWAQSTIDPTVFSSDPEPNQSDVPLSKVITITFFTPAMDPATTASAFHFYAEGGDPYLDNLREDGYLEIENNILTFTPPPLDYNTTYWLEVESTATDVDGNPLDGNNNGTGGEVSDDWKMMFTTVVQSVSPPTTREHWSDVYDQNNGLPESMVSCLALDSHDRLWVGTQSKISYFDGLSWENKTPDVSPYIINNITGLVIDSQDRVWAGLGISPEGDSNAPLLAQWTDNAWQSFPAKSLGLMTDETIAKIAVDTADNLWIATSESRVLKYSVGQSAPSYYPIDGGLPITSLVVDKANNVWVGTAFLGLYKLASGSSDWQSKDIGQTIHTVNVMAADKSGNIWVGTESGLLKLDTATGTLLYTVASTNGGLPGDVVTALAVDSGVIWVGTSDGLAKFDEVSKWANFAVENASGLSGQKINSLAIDPRGEVWLGTDNGLMLRDEVDPVMLVDESYPADGGQVDISAKIRVTFSEPMNRGLTEDAFTLMDANQTAIGGEFTWSGYGRVLEFTPYTLKANQTYTVLVDTSAVDLAGNPPSGGEYRISFSTAGQASDTTPPVLGQMSYSTTLLNVEIKDDGEGVDSDTISLLLTTDSGPVSGKTNISGDKNSLKVTFIPDTPFIENKSITVSVTAQDLAGNPLTTSFQISPQGSLVSRNSVSLSGNGCFIDTLSSWLGQIL